MAPLVVLAGWLGCQPKNLRRYEELYRTIGIRSMVRIAPPHVVVKQVFAPPLDPIVAPSGWPKRCAATRDGATMQTIAWDILQHVHNEGYTSLYFHAFSNGGCFVWEQIRRILLEGPQHVSSQTEAILTALHSLREKLRGVIFDSCPVVNMNRLDKALEHCTESERKLVWDLHGAEIKSLVQSGDVGDGGNDIRDIAQRRIEAYEAGLRSDPLPIPQLYLYSRDDPLAPAPYIDELVAYRRSTNGPFILSRVWDESTHCSHLLRHPLDYTESVRMLVEEGARNGEQLSKL